MRRLPVALARTARVATVVAACLMRGVGRASSKRVEKVKKRLRRALDLQLFQSYALVRLFEIL